MTENKSPTRHRHRQVKFWVNDEEYALIQEKMKEFGTSFMGAFIRKMVIDGYIIKLDLPELKEITRLLGITSNNVNQIARMANVTNSIYKQDIEDIQQQLDQVYKQLRNVLIQLSKIK